MGQAAHAREDSTFTSPPKTLGEQHESSFVQDLIEEFRSWDTPHFFVFSNPVGIAREQVKG